MHPWRRPVGPYQPLAILGGFHRGIASRKGSQQKKSLTFTARTGGVEGEPPVTELDDMGEMALVIAPGADPVRYLPT